MVSKARKRLFGSWEMNWMAYNYAHDVALAGSEKQPLVYCLHPQAETPRGAWIHSIRTTSRMQSR